MDFVKLLPPELLEEIFGHLSMNDLKSCSEVSTAWREVANSNVFWKRLCINNTRIDPCTLDRIETNFLNHACQFRVPDISQRLSPTNMWKLHYCRMNFISYNWQRGRYSTHWCGKKITNQYRVNFSSKLPADRLYLPVVEEKEKLYTLLLLRLDGIPRKVCTLFQSPVIVSVVCVDRQWISFVHMNEVKYARLETATETDELRFEMVTLGQLIACDTPVSRADLCNVSNYVLLMDENYIVAGFSLSVIKIWCRKTDNLLISIPVPYANCVFSGSYLYHGHLFFSCNQEEENAACFVRDYRIGNDEWGPDVPVVNPVKRILCNDRYLLIALKENVNRYLITIRERSTHILLWSIAQDSSQNWGMLEPVVNIHNDCVFFLEGFNIKIVTINEGLPVREFTVNSTILAIENVRDNLILLRSRTEVEVWDWKTGAKLYTPGLECAETAVFNDDTRLVFVGLHKEVKIIGFW